jgi:hypothetical protein
VRHGRFIPQLLAREGRYLLIAAFILCCSQIAQAQSGRRPVKNESPPVKSDAQADTQTAAPPNAPARGVNTIVARVMAKL